MPYEILSLYQITKQYGTRLILDNVSLLLNRGERCALVGENGAGKTTLARIILNEEQADSRQIRLARQCVIGYLPQEVTAVTHMTVSAYIAEAVGDLHAIAQRMTAPSSTAQPHSLQNCWRTSQHTLTIYNGNYEDYLYQREQAQQEIYQLSVGQRRKLVLPA